MAKLKDLTIMDYQKNVRGYENESDRAVAILAASFLENFLGKYLRHFMADDKITDELFDGYGPFSTFAQKINTAYAFKFIHKSIKNNLDIIKQIRNEFAHAPHVISFNDEKMKVLCNNLSTAKETHCENEPSKKYRIEKPRDQYLTAIGLITGQLHNAMIKK